MLFCENPREEELRCLICGAKTFEGKICDCCKESLALCDIENLVSRKEHGENCAVRRANAFK